MAAFLWHAIRISGAFRQEILLLSHACVILAHADCIRYCACAYMLTYDLRIVFGVHPCPEAAVAAAVLPYAVRVLVAVVFVRLLARASCPDQSVRDFRNKSFTALLDVTQDNSAEAFAFFDTGGVFR